MSLKTCRRTCAFVNSPRCTMDEQDNEDPISGAVIWLLKLALIIGGAIVVAALLAAVGA